MVALLLLLYAASLTPSPELHGTVVDPQSLPISGARVELICLGEATATITDDSGSFALPRLVPQDTCSLSVTREGFAPFRQRIRSDARADLVLRLRLATVREV